MRQYIVVGRKSRQFRYVNDPNWPDNWERKYLPRHRPENVEAYHIDGMVEGVPYSEELANINGMTFTLLVRDPSTIQPAKDWLRSRRDVVSFRVIRLGKQLPTHTVITNPGPVGWTPEKEAQE